MPNSVPADAVFTVSNLTFVLRETLEANFAGLTLEGEISNYRPNASGHLYFTLKDEGASISAVMFRGNAYKLNFVPKDGMKVRATGSITVYAPRGQYQIVINKMEIAGAGNILQVLEERKQRLAAEGLFNHDRKKPIPFYSQRIGIVTSPTGAALRDILQITRRRNPGVDVVILPALVQGEGAAVTIANMVKTANDFNLCDVLIVGRGGGSLEDLLPFSEEIVVRSIADSKIPVVSAVGHEIDWSLADYAADMRAPTPSAAAELVVPKQSDLLQELSGYKNELYTQISSKVERLKLMIKSFDVNNMEIRFRSIQQPLLNRLENARENLLSGINDKIKDTRNFIQQSVSILEGASPQTILNRGYSMVRTPEGKIVRSQQDVSSGTKLQIYPASGMISATVD
ncbi:MAG: exodeoxyribonuclease VII large subunit [Treponema sp.]|nr:exodeoxyribonuclease VII large subunit [Candidatus Treponema equifaecale]